MATSNQTNDQLAAVNSELMNFNSVLASNIANYEANKQTNATNAQIAQNTNAMNQQLNDANIAFQARENEIARAREDNAVRRRVNDLVGAGLSKTLAAGSAASANAMEAPSNDFEMRGYTAKAPEFDFRGNYGNYMLSYRNVQLQEKQQELYKRELDIKKQEADAVASHYERQDENDSKALKENERYHDLMDKWEQAKLDETSTYHKEAIKLDWAKQQLNESIYLTNAEQIAIQNVWYETQIEIAKNGDERDAMRLTSDLAEASARIEKYLVDVDLSKAQLDYIEKESKYVAQLTINTMIQRGLLKAEYRDTMITAFTKVYNLIVAQKQKSKTTDSSVSTSTATENALDRKAGLRNTLINTGKTALSIGAGVFLGAGGGKMIQKALGWDDHNPGPWY